MILLKLYQVGLRFRMGSCFLWVGEVVGGTGV